MGTFVLPHLTSRLSVGSWPPKLPRSAFDARWPPLETWHLEYIRVASSGGICPLTCAKVGAERGGCASAINAAIAGTVAAAEYTTALSIAPSQHSDLFAAVVRVHQILKLDQTQLLHQRV